MPGERTTFVDAIFTTAGKALSTAGSKPFANETRLATLPPMSLAATNIGTGWTAPKGESPLAVAQDPETAPTTTAAMIHARHFRAGTNQAGINDDIRMNALFGDVTNVLSQTLTASESITRKTHVHYATAPATNQSPLPLEPESHASFQYSKALSKSNAKLSTVTHLLVLVRQFAGAPSPTMPGTLAKRFPIVGPLMFGSTAQHHPLSVSGLERESSDFATLQGCQLAFPSNPGQRAIASILRKKSRAYWGKSQRGFQNYMRPRVLQARLLKATGQEAQCCVRTTRALAVKQF